MSNYLFLCLVEDYIFLSLFLVVREEREGGMGMAGGLSTCLRLLWYVEDFLPRRLLCQPYGLSNSIVFVSAGRFMYVFSHPTSFSPLI